MPTHRDKKMENMEKRLRGMEERMANSNMYLEFQKVLIE